MTDYLLDPRESVKFMITSLCSGVSTVRNLVTTAEIVRVLQLFVDTVLVPMRLRNVTRLMINVVLIARVMVFQEKHFITGRAGGS